ncbi:hypothetical protein CAPTEDRAFT_173924 [Capitella teleta]|uniref:FH2 domain-containing protein n=1 Tax=Capitella teleta TaxID=283909 RepID=R7V942_CAPTE|nr:hypothetical protein CAPTEDRAFT_173924 [Capitella teleta]|eukprot:ELU12881.1 hypothetical protein CAPTEDRAFT_173924 [Capitella teleta]
MKPLFWKRICSHELPKASPEAADFLWEKLDEAPFDVEEFGDLFCKAPVKKKVSTEKQVPRKKTKERASPAELSDLEAHLKAKPDTTLDRPEQFLLDLARIPNFAERCFCLIFHSSFDESLTIVENSLNNIRLLCQMLMSSDSVQKVLSLILALGNYMNGGTSRGQADGFGLEILSKLKDVKSKDSTCSLLAYVVKQYVKLSHMEETSPEATPSNVKATMPLPEPSDIVQASTVNFDDIELELKKIEQAVRGCEQKVTKVLQESTTESVALFQSSMEKFLLRACAELKIQENNLMEAKKRFSQCCVFFTVRAKSADSSVSPCDFFSLWMPFAADFKDLWKREQQRMVMKRIERAQKRVKEIQEERKKSVVSNTSPKSKKGLKAKLASKGMI